MLPNPVEKIVSVSSEHPDHKVFSLITGFGSWTTENVGEEKAEIELKLTDLAQISRIEIANESSAWVDIRVSREGIPDVPLLPTLCLQTRKESKECENCRAKRVLETGVFNEDVRSDKFDYVKVICRQPFNRNIRYGLSQLKFYTQPSESKTKNPQRSNSLADSEEVVLNIVGDKTEEDSGKLIGSLIKTASFRHVDRAKRIVNTSVADEDAEESTDELRPKATPSIIRNSFNPSASKTSTPIVPKNSFVFAPAASAADQETRAKKAAAEADQVIPGRSPKKSKLSYKAATAIYTPANESSGERKQQPDEGHSGESNLSFLKKTLASWKGADRSNQTPKSRPRSPEARSSDTRSPKAYIISPELKRRRLEDDDQERRRVPPPTRIQRIDAMLTKSPSGRPGAPRKNRSVVHAPRNRGVISPFVVKVNTKPKQQKITNLMERIFSSSESDGEASTPTQGSRDIQRGDTSHGAVAEEPSCCIEDDSTVNHIKSEEDERIAEIIESDEEVVVKTESSFNEKNSHVDLCGEDVVETMGREQPSAKKKRNRNPPINCEVESDSDLEVVGNDLMKGVVFTLSGFKNPYRSSLRSMAISMGARYRPDWDDSCTHLICAFKNTPKYLEVSRKNGKIVTAAWIATSHLKQKLSDWRK
ncbi:DNA repair protein XRCC1 [Galendromus occidentalis]|uniref:DNA repair protein XRCC1 n=1 Tax=Galendromus occidentalis TaxID=34638 RepID=A0AAJ7WIN0_9ACAR|nr:DNA repair protein XRCC1 [Galendromus occidentalis]